MANASGRDALTALIAFADATRAQYAQNLALLKAAPGQPSGCTPFNAAALAEAQSYSDQNGPSFVLLSHLIEGGKIDPRETEAMSWLANDAIVFDTSIAAMANPNQSAREARHAAEVFGEMTMVRAVFLKCLVGAFLHAVDTELMKRVSAQDPHVVESATMAAQQSAKTFESELAPVLQSIQHVDRAFTFARAVQFPLIPMVIGHKKQDAENVNGVWMNTEMAKQLRASIAQQKAAL